MSAPKPLRKEIKMIKTKKQLREESSIVPSIYQKEADRKLLAEDKTICVFILDEDALNLWDDLDMFPSKGIMMNRAELSVLLSGCKKSPKRSATKVIVYGQGNACGVWTAKESYHWYK